MKRRVLAKAIRLAAVDGAFGFALLFPLVTHGSQRISTAPSPAVSFPFPSTSKDGAAIATTLPGLAREVIVQYRESDRFHYLDNLFRLQSVAGRYAEAEKTLADLQALRGNVASPVARAVNLQYEIYLRAKIRTAAGGIPFAEALSRSFRETFAALDDRTSALVARALEHYSPGISLHVPIEERLQAALKRQKGKISITLANALDLLRAYQVADTYRVLEPLVDPLIAQDDRKRYRIQQSLVRTSNGAHICALVVRPLHNQSRLPALLQFGIYADPDVMLSEARRDASNGYASVQGLTRGKGCSPDKPVSEKHDGADADALVDWIAHQPWSDGRVGMYGGSYGGFTQWAAAKRPPAALKALMPSVTYAPGIDSPMEGNIVLTFGYYWPFYVTDNKTVDDKAFNDHARWNRLFRNWYVSGRAYRDLARIDGAPNPVWNEYLDHPGYDAWWQSMIPYRDEFAHIRIPVLTTTGYFDGGQIGALYYLREQAKYDPAAEHYLLIGPYDHHTGNRGTVDVLGDEADVLDGYAIDPVAHIDLGELRYRWFDYIFRHGAKPALLTDKINYEVMGRNMWRHAPSLAAMGNGKLRYFMGDGHSGTYLKLENRRPGKDLIVGQTMNFADRSDADRVAPGGNILDSAIDTSGSLVFESKPFAGPVEVSGLFSGQLDFIANKKDFDFEIMLYELTQDGKYFSLSSFLARASYVRDKSLRQLLVPGTRQRLAFESGRLTSRLFPAGSRLIVVLSLIKIEGAQINYGTGKDVSDETIADAGTPLRIRWFSDSFIDVPLRR